MNRSYLLYDARAYHDYYQGMRDIVDCSRAAVLTVSHTVDEAMSDALESGDCICFSYISKRNRLTDERMEFYYDGSEFKNEALELYLQVVSLVSEEVSVNDARTE